MVVYIPSLPMKLEFHIEPQQNNEVAYFNNLLLALILDLIAAASVILGVVINCNPTQVISGSS